MSEPNELLLDLARRKFTPLCVFVDTELRVADVIGDPTSYGFDGVVEGASALGVFPFLIGADLDRVFEFEFMETPNGRCAHIHWRKFEDRQVLLAIDATTERDQRRMLQQKSNEVQLLLETQSRLLEKQKRLNDVQARFIGNMSHEFRTPLASIVSYAQYLMTPQPKIDMATGLHSIDAAARYLSNLVDNLIDQAQFELKQFELRPSAASIVTVAADLESMFQATAHAKGLEFRIIVSPCIPRTLRFDAIRLRQVLINLVGNAFKFTQNGFVSLELDWCNDVLTVSVRDSGRGISGSALDTIFEAFTRDQDTDVGGAGLGLSISQRIVNMMGGQIRIASTLGEGTRASFTVAAREFDDSTPTRPEVSGELTVLVVEDDTDVYEILEIYLDEAGFFVIHADSGAAALDVFRTTAPTAVVTDLQLPDMSGIELTETLRNSGFDGAIVMLTASSASQDRASAVAAGCNEFLVKPVAGAALLRVLSVHTGAGGERR